MIWDTAKNANRQLTTDDLAAIGGGGGGGGSAATVADGNAKAPSIPAEAGSNNKILADIQAAFLAPPVFNENGPQVVNIPANTVTRITFPSGTTKELNFLWYGTTPLCIGVGSVSGTLNGTPGTYSRVIPPSDGVTPNTGRSFGRRADGQYIAGFEHWGFSTGGGILTIDGGQ